MAAFGWDSEWEGETGWQRGETTKSDIMGEQTQLLRARHFKCGTGKGAKTKTFVLKCWTGKWQTNEPESGLLVVMNIECQYY